MYVQTWLPLPSFRDSVRSLSDEHLGLQRLHALHLIEALHEVEPQASKLPDDYDADAYELDRAVLMWSGHEMQLCEYGLEACDEWSGRRGKRDRLYDAIFKNLEWATSEVSSMNKPNWFGDTEFHLGHQAELLRLDPEFYRPYFMVDTDRELIWPKAESNE